MKKLIALLLVICMVTLQSCSTFVEISQTPNSNANTNVDTNANTSTTAPSKSDEVTSTDLAVTDTSEQDIELSTEQDEKQNTEVDNLESNVEELDFTPYYDPSEEKVYEPLNSNFKKVLDFSESGIDLAELGIEEEYYEDFIRLYELGFVELENLPDVSDDLVFICLFKFMAICNEGTFPTEVEVDYGIITIENIAYNYSGVWTNEAAEVPFFVLNAYNLLTIGEAERMLLHSDDQFWFYDEDYEFGPQSDMIYRGGYRHTTIGYGQFCNQQMQVLLTRLLKLIDIGEPINTLESIVDVPHSSDPYLINAAGVLELFNMGIFTGDEYGRFNAYDGITPSEFVAILARLCFPSRRVKIDTEVYNKNSSRKLDEVKTYNDIDEETYNEVLAYTNLKALYPFEQSETKYMTWEEAIYVVCRLARGELAGQTDVEPSIISAKEVHNRISSERFSEDSEAPSWDLTKGFDGRYSRVKYCTAEELSSNEYIAGKEYLSKLDLATLLCNIASSKPSNTIGSERNWGVDLEQFRDKIALSEELLKTLKNTTMRQKQLYSEIVTLGLLENTVEDFTQEYVTEAEFERMLVHFAIVFSDYLVNNANVEG